MMERLLDILANSWRGALEIALLAVVIYYLLVLMRGTRGAQVLTGFLVAMFLVILVTKVFRLDVINWIISRFFAFFAFAVLVIFQPELRRLLAELGSRYFIAMGTKERAELTELLVETARLLSQRRIGALIAVEREVGFRGIAETGVPIESRATPELLTTIFYPNTPLHDGGVILRGDRVVAAACIFPLSQKTQLEASLGLRHRAALGLSEETDAVILIVSEETGAISLAHRGQLTQNLSIDELRHALTTIWKRSEQKESVVVRWLRRWLGPLPLNNNEPKSAVSMETMGAEANEEEKRSGAP
jgi:diadenylate cyclase